MSFPQCFRDRILFRFQLNIEEGQTTVFSVQIVFQNTQNWKSGDQGGHRSRQLHSFSKENGDWENFSRNYGNVMKRRLI